MYLDILPTIQTLKKKVKKNKEKKISYDKILIDGYKKYNIDYKKLPNDISINHDFYINQNRILWNM